MRLLQANFFLSMPDYIVNRCTICLLNTYLRAAPLGALYWQFSCGHVQQYIFIPNITYILAYIHHSWKSGDGIRGNQEKALMKIRRGHSWKSGEGIRGNQVRTFVEIRRGHSWLFVSWRSSLLCLFNHGECYKLGRQPRQSYFACVNSFILYTIVHDA